LGPEGNWQHVTSCRNQSRLKFPLILSRICHRSSHPRVIGRSSSRGNFSSSSNASYVSSSLQKWHNRFHVLRITGLAKDNRIDRIQLPRSRTSAPLIRQHPQKFSPSRWISRLPAAHSDFSGIRDHTRNSIDYRRQSEWKTWHSSRYETRRSPTCILFQNSWGV
jgi:hypothetical protein